MAGRVRLDADAQHLPVLAEAGGAHRPVDLRIVGAVERVEAEAPLVGLGRALEPLLGEGRGADPGDRRPAGVHPLGPRAVIQELQAARGHAERDALGVGELRLGHAREPACGQRGPEHADHAGGMEAQAVEPALGGGGDPGCALDGREIGHERLPPRGAVALAGGQHRRHRARRGVDHAADVGVVVVEAVDEESVHLSGIAQRQRRRHPDDGIGPVAGEPVDRGQRLVAEVVARRREADPQRVENVQLGALDHGLGHVFERKLAGEARQRARDRLAGRGFGLRGGRFGEGHRGDSVVVDIERPQSSTALWPPPPPCDCGRAIGRCPERSP